jgi:hypothetical protein
MLLIVNVCAKKKGNNSRHTGVSVMFLEHIVSSVMFLEHIIIIIIYASETLTCNRKYELEEIKKKRERSLGKF